MKYLKYKCLLAIILGCSLSGCFDLTEEVFDRVDSGVYYQDENSVKSAVATIYSTGATSYVGGEKRCVSKFGRSENI